MEAVPVVIERTYQAPIQKVWKAITDKGQMKEWYFEVSDFKAEEGFRFRFYGGSDERKFLHLCEVTEVNAPSRLTYSWRYEGFKGQSFVTFELFREAENKTRLKLTHTGIDTFPQDDKNFAVASFTEGWNFILGESLRNFVETESITKSILIHAPAKTVWDIVLHPNHQWGKAFGEGALVETDWQAGSKVIWTDMEGNVGANGIVAAYQESSFLQVDFYDDIDLAPGTPLGDYAEKFKLASNPDGSTLLNIEAGSISKKDGDMHSKMWEDALEIIKNLAEK